MLAYLPFIVVNTIVVAAAGHALWLSTRIPAPATGGRSRLVEDRRAA